MPENNTATETPAACGPGMKKVEVKMTLYIDLDKYEHPNLWDWNDILGFTSGFAVDRAKVRTTVAQIVA